MLTLNDIVNKKFEKTLSGYRMDDVDNFFYQVVDFVTNLENEKNEEKKKLLVLANRIEEYRGEEESLKQAVLGAQKLGDSIIKEAKNRAEIIIKDATIKGEIIVKNKKDEAKKEEIILNKMKREVDSFKCKMLTLYNSHIELLNSLPEYKEEVVPDIAVKEKAPAVEEKKEQAVEEKTQEKVSDPETNLEFELAMPETATFDEKNEETTESGFPVIDDNSDSEFKIASGFKIGKFEENKEEKIVSKFGPLKFGDGYDINDDHNKK